MTDKRPSPPDLEAWLDAAYPSSQKGGTLIEPAVRELETHEAWMRAPGRYRPAECLRCGATLHIHDYRPRQLRGDPWEVTQVVRFLCCNEACRATWQVLPMFIARHLWRTWRVVEHAVEPESSTPIPAATVARWRSRLDLGARLLVTLLATASKAVLDAIVQLVGLDVTRAELVRTFAREMRTADGECLAEIAELVHRLQRGVRLM